MIEPVPNGFRWAGLCGGVLALALATAAGQVPPPPAPAGVTVNLLTSATGSLTSSPAGLVVAALSLHPDGGSLDGRLILSNHSSRTAPLAVRATTTDDGLADRLWLDIAAGGRFLYRGPLAGLARALRLSAPIRAGQERTFTVSVSIRPERSPQEYAGRSADVRIFWQPATSKDPRVGSD